MERSRCLFFGKRLLTVKSLIFILIVLILTVNIPYINIKVKSHPNIGIFLFCLTVILIFAIIAVLAYKGQKEEKAYKILRSLIYLHLQKRLVDISELHTNEETTFTFQQLCKLDVFNSSKLHKKISSIPESIDLKKVYRNVAFKIRKEGNLTVVKIGRFVGGSEIPDYCPDENDLKRLLETQSEFIVVTKTNCRWE